MKSYSFYRTALLFTLLTILMLLSSVIPAHAAFAPELKQDIVQSCTENRPVNISAYQLSEEALDQLFLELSYGGRLPWYAQDSYRYSYDNASGQILYFYPVPLDEEGYDRGLYETRVAEIIADTVHDGMSQWQQALSVHDYLAANFCYDESFTYYNGYDLLIHGTAVCEGYAEAYMDILNRLGIPCIMVISEDMDHSWNLVNLDGSWYHVDVTWDDPSSDVYGQVMHDYFLVTDQEMAEDHAARLSEGDGGHYNWRTDYVCEDQTYTDAFWKDVNSQICYPDSNTSFLRRTEDWDSFLHLRDEHTGEETRLFTDKEEYINVGEGKYSYSHLGLSLWNGRLYFSSTDTVYSMALDGSDVTEEYRHNPKQSKTFIYGSFVKDGTLYLTLCDHTFNQTSLKIPLPSAEHHVHSYTQTLLPATCRQDGHNSYACDCGIYVELTGDKAAGHNYASTVEAHPSLNQTGQIRYTCTGCNDTYYTTIPALTFWEWLAALLS